MIIITHGIIVFIYFCSTRPYISGTIVGTGSIFLFSVALGIPYLILFCFPIYISIAVLKKKLGPRFVQQYKIQYKIQVEVPVSKPTFYTRDQISNAISISHHRHI
jgi:hypothetical protein